MKRVFIVHRWSGDPEGDWRGWLKKELEDLGFEVIAPEMPDKEIPVIEKWVGHLAKLVGTPNEDTYFVGHSMGAQTILRYLETIDTKVGGAIFVAGWVNLKNLEYGELNGIAKPWIETPIDAEKIKAVLPKSALLISDNDPYEYFEENKEGYSKFGTKIVVVHGAKHFTDVDGFYALPTLLAEFKELL
ncbi:MAG TPA: alpha/beta hydrolase [Patescibacteria group bacterium]|jgi:hypothetical protein|nr:alpha/beta hydrolase [Patescibacteria group bacterium]